MWLLGHKSCISPLEANLYEDTAKFHLESFVLTNGGGDIFSWRKLNLPLFSSSDDKLCLSATGFPGRALSLR